MNILRNFGISISLASFITVSYLFFNMDYTLFPVKLYKTNIDTIIIDPLPKTPIKIITKSIKNNALDTIDENEIDEIRESEDSNEDI